MWLSESWRKDPKECAVDYQVKAVILRNEAAWKEVFGVRDDAKERCLEVYKEEKR